MKTKAIVVSLIAVTAGVFLYTRPHNAMPSDLRDAVADNREFDTTIPVVTKDPGDIPVPPVVAANVRKSITWPVDRKFVAQNYDKVDELATKMLTEKDKSFTPKSWVGCYEAVLMKLVKVPGWHGGLIPPSYNPEEVVKVFPSYPDMTSFGESEAMATLLSINKSLLTVYQDAAEKFPKDFPGFFSEVSKPASAIFAGVKKAESLEKMRYTAAEVSELGNLSAAAGLSVNNSSCGLVNIFTGYLDPELLCVYRCGNGKIQDYPLSAMSLVTRDIQFPVTVCPQRIPYY